MAAPPPPPPSRVQMMGCDILFPVGKKPFPAQLALMSSMIRALTKRENALLESPTGAASPLRVTFHRPRCSVAAPWPAGRRYHTARVIT